MKKTIIFLLFIPLSVLSQEKTFSITDSLPVPFQIKLFSSFPMIQKSQDKFFIYDLVSERLIIADEKLNLIGDTIASRGKGRLVNDNTEIKLLHKAMYVGKKDIYFGGAPIYRYSHTLEKLPIHRLSYKSPNPLFKTLSVVDLGFLVDEDEKVNRYIIRTYTTSADNIDYQEIATKKFYLRPMYALFEKNVRDTTLTPIKKMIIPYDKIYQEKLLLGYTYTQTITFGKKGTLITTEGSSEKMRIYNMEGKEIDEIGEKGGFMTKSDTVPYLLYPQDSSNVFWEKMGKTTNNYARTVLLYGQAYYDKKSEKIYREYSPSAQLGEHRKRFMQVYQKKKLVADAPFPIGHRIIAIENGVIWTYKINDDGETPPQFIYKFKLQ